MQRNMPAITKRRGQRNPGKCTHCGRPTPWVAYRARKTCSAECLYARQRDSALRFRTCRYAVLRKQRRKPGRCANCGMPTPWRNGKRLKTCSSKCTLARLGANPPPRKPAYKCVICGDPCLEKKHGHRRKSCSADCLKEWHRRIATKAAPPSYQCEYCRSWFPQHKSKRGANRFCSLPCSRAALRQQGFTAFRLRSLELKASIYARNNSALLPDTGL